MAQTQINFDVEDDLKARFEESLKASGYMTMAEAFRDFMRKVIQADQLTVKPKNVK